MSTKIGLDNPIFAGRIRSDAYSARNARREVISARARSYKDGQIVRVRPHNVPDSQIEYVEELANEIVPEDMPERMIVLGGVQYTLPEAEQKLKLHRFHLPNRTVILQALAVILFIVGLGAAASIYVGNKRVLTTVEASVAENNTPSQQNADGALPDESKPSEGAVRSYSVSPVNPRFVRINKIGVEARIRSLGTNKKGEVATPANIYDAGWYSESSKPGDEGGAMLLDGHVSGPTKKGVFFDIKNLVAGDSVEVERGDGKKYSFSVVKIQIFDANKVDMASLLTPIKSGSFGLNLITCTGKYDSKTHQYNQRAVVYAVRQ